MTDRDKLGLIAQYILCEDTKLYNELQRRLQRLQRCKNIDYYDLLELQKFLVERAYFDNLSHQLSKIMFRND